MHDQATDLRQLARDAAHIRDEESSFGGSRNRPRLAVITSGKGGVGTTTIAVNLAVAMARGGRQIILVDADPHGGDVALLCGLEERHTLADVLAGRRTAAEVFQPAAGPIQVIPGVWGLQRLSDFPPAAIGRLLGQLQRFQTPADLIIVDAGNHPHAIARRFCRAADLILAVTTPQKSSILDTYTSIKTIAEDETPGPIHALVNQATGPEVAAEVQGRLAHACRRFLGISLQDAGHVPADPRVAASAMAAEPLVIAAPGCDAARQIDRLAETLTVRAIDETTLETSQENTRPQRPTKRTQLRAVCGR